MTTKATPSKTATDPSRPLKEVIVVGAGPSGLLLSILLARSNTGIKVTLLDAAADLDTNPRAAHYAPSACYDLDRAGVLADVRERGFHPDSVCWRKPDGTLLGGIRMDKVQIEYPMVCLPLDRLDRLLLEHLERCEDVEVQWNHKVVSVRQDDNKAEVEVELEGGERKWLSADYIIGADGANSGVRRALFGETNYPGETLQKQIIATNVYYDFHQFNYWDSNFIISEDDWFMAAKITKDGLWRVTYGDDWGLSNEEYLKRQPMRYQKILPGHPTPDQYTIVSASPYKLHQRLAPSLRSGRFLLVADAAHLCNPFGGMGLTGGIADVGSLYDALMAMQKGRVGEEVLTEYSRVRSQRWKEMIDPMSRKNFGLIWDPDMEKDREEFFAFCGKLDMDRELATQMANGTHGLRENFEDFIAKQSGVGETEVNGVEEKSGMLKTGGQGQEERKLGFGMTSTEVKA